MILRILSLLTLLSVLAPLAAGQGSRADYERALALSARTEGLLAGEALDLNWIEEGDRLWYRQELADGKRQFLLVDCKLGEKLPLFDHGVIAQAVSKMTGESADPERLPIEMITLEGHRIFLLLDSGTEACEFDRRSGEARAVPLGEVDSLRLKPRRRVSQSRGGRGDTSILFVNGLDVPLEVFWVQEGGARRAYGSVAPGEVKRQHTIPRHAWVLVDREGNDRAAFVAEKNPGVAWVGPGTRALTSERGTPAKKKPERSQAKSGGKAKSKTGVSIRDHNVWLHNQKTGLDVPLTSDGSEDNAYGGRVLLSPDGKRAVVMRKQASDEHTVYYVESAPSDQVQPKLQSYSYLKPGDKIAISKPHLFDLESQKEIPLVDDLFPNPWSIRDVRWSPDSSRFTFRYNQRGHEVLRVVAVDATSGQASTVVEETPDTFVDYSNKQFAHHLDDSQELIWMSERDGWNHLYLIDAKRGKVKHQITKGQWVVRGVDRVDDEKQQIWFRALGLFPDQDPYHIHYCRIDFDGGNLVHLTEADGTHSVQYSPDKRHYVDRYSRVDLAPVSELRRSEDGSLVCELARADVSALLATGWRAPERFVAKGRDGKTDIWGIIRRPTNYDSARTYPVIEQIYAGPHGHHVPKSFRRHSTAEEVAELGFIVVQIDGMGTNWRSKAFHDVCWKNIGDGGFPDRMLWIQAAAAQDPSMDISKVGIYGGSAGGQNAMRALLAHPDFYYAAVADCGCHDNRMDKIWWNEAWMGWPIGPHYEEQSNVTQAHKLEGKLMLFVGEMDRNVDPASTIQVVDALIRANKDFDFILIPGAGHGASESSYGRRRRRDFFVRHLMGVEPRWE